MKANEHSHPSDIERDKRIEKRLSEFKNKFGEEFGEDVVLIAYKRDKPEGSWH
ncbi:MAG TPA: hypothetical protein VEB00_10105 [Clostridia bacterium]|nr:hypothetical protein [Clostridia bacterium]